jgi:RNA polymerase sigma-70 factor (ECF subfamily)
MKLASARALGVEFSEPASAMNTADQADFDDAFRRYRGYLQFLAETKLDRRLRRKIDPSDVVQETMLLACRGWHDLRGQDEAVRMAWLRQILLRTLLHAIRDFSAAKRNVAREQALVQLADESSACLEAEWVADQTSPSQSVERAEELVRVADALQELPAPQRDAVIAFYWHGCTLAEIGADLDRSMPAVSGLIYRGIKRLNARLATPIA